MCTCVTARHVPKPPQLNMVKLSYRTAHAKRLSVEQESLHYQVGLDWG